MENSIWFKEKKYEYCLSFWFRFKIFYKHINEYFLTQKLFKQHSIRLRNIIVNRWCYFILFGSVCKIGWYHQTSCLLIIKSVEGINSIDHDLLKQKLKQIFFEPSIDSVNSFKNDWVHKTLTDNIESNWISIHGVPQGTVMRPLFFNLYIADRDIN